MKKIVFVIICMLLLVAFPISAFATDEPVNEGALPEVNEDVYIPEEENATEGEISAPDSVDNVEATEEKTVAETIVSFITENYTGSSLISLAITVIIYLFYEIKKNKSLNGSIGILNNNAVQIAEKSTLAISNVLNDAKDIADIVKGYKDEIASLLTEIKKNAEEKENLEKTLHSVQAFLATSKLATIELSNEVAELLVLANIPNSKKDELYARHVAAVEAISTEENAEGMNYDGEKA